MTAAAFHVVPQTAPPVGARRVAGLIGLLRPFLILGSLAFFAGFGGYLILGPPQVMGTLATSAAQPAALAPVVTEEPASAPTSSEWNLPKHI